MELSANLVEIEIELLLRAFMEQLISWFTALLNEMNY